MSKIGGPRHSGEALGALLRALGTVLGDGKGSTEAQTGRTGAEDGPSVQAKVGDGPRQVRVSHLK